MWIDVTGWTGSIIHGLLNNEPADVPGLKKGAPMELEEDDVFDDLHLFPDGHEEGNETAPLLQGR